MIMQLEVLQIMYMRLKLPFVHFCETINQQNKTFLKKSY